jgi:hypothetical protein
VYCLLGIFRVFLPLIYGEGEEYATRRLEDEIARRQKGQGTRDQHDLPGAKPAPSSTVPFRRDDDFVARNSLKDIHNICAQPAGRAALVGLGGVG